MSGIKVIAMVCLLSTPTMVVSQSKDTEKRDSKPSITLSAVPNTPPGEDVGDISGKVAGVNANDCKVVIFAYGDKWYVQPWANAPFTDIDEDMTFETKTHGGTEYAALLVKSSYKPPATASILPTVGGDILAVSKKKPKK